MYISFDPVVTAFEIDFAEHFGVLVTNFTLVGVVFMGDQHMLDSFSIYLIGFNIQLFRSNVDSFSIYLIDLTIQLFRSNVFCDTILSTGLAGFLYVKLILLK